jgi:hypothetical protein
MGYFQGFAFALIVCEIINPTNQRKNIAHRSIQNVHHQSIILKAFQQISGLMR